MSKRKSRANDFPSYGTPPVIEVVCGIRFTKIESLKVPHFGLFWQKVRDEYPICEHAIPLLSPEGPRTILEADNLLPRVWLINEKKNGLIQLQSDRFLYNWRRMHEDEVYPRYRTVIEAFKINLKIFEEFIEKENLGSVNPIECELTYINHIPKGEGWESVAGIHELLPDLDWRSGNGRFLPEPDVLGWQALFSLPEDAGRLHVKLEQKIRKIDNFPLLSLEISARGLGVDKSLNDIWKWFELAHEWIVFGFTDLTGQEIQKEIWGRKDDIPETK